MAADKIKHKYGKMPELIAGKDPSLTPVERVWTKLTNEQQDSVIKNVRQLALRNRRASWFSFQQAQEGLGIGA